MHQQDLHPCSMADSVPPPSQGKAFHLLLNLSFMALLLFFLTTHLGQPIAALQLSPKPITNKIPSQSPDNSNDGCNGLQHHKTSESKCTHLISEPPCDSQGFINYLYLFYCTCGRYPVLGYAILILWLIVLFYLLADTTANYFCPNLEGLSRFLKLSPTLAGVTLLSLGNGAPDVFSTIVSFLGTSSSNVGLNGVLGGAFFVSSVVVGAISICLGPRGISIDKSNFVRDICFLLLLLSVLLVIVIIGEINLWGALAFTSLYAVYALLVSIHHFYRKDEERDPIESGPLLPTSKSLDSSEDLGAPLLSSVEVDEPIFAVKVGQWREEIRAKFTSLTTSSHWIWWSRILWCLELPLYLPRRITIPDVCKERWCKAITVVSVVLAPILLATLWVSKGEEELGSEESLVIFLFGGLAGVVLGIATFVKTKKESPPTAFLFPWHAGGFLMGVVWTYITAEELVSLLVSLGTILDVSPSILGFTVLAWGNSIGDLTANLAVALNGGPGGAQVAMSGCYGGPIFNTLVGLGLSLILSSWHGYPSPCAIPKDPRLFQILGFLIGGLLWTLVILPSRGMRPDRLLGCGLLSIYLCFLTVRLGSQFLLLQ